MATDASPSRFPVILPLLFIFISLVTCLYFLQLPGPGFEIVNLGYVTPGFSSDQKLLPRQALKYIDSTGKSSIIYEIDKSDAAWLISFDRPVFSPKKDYLATNYTNYEGGLPPSIFRVSDHKDIISGQNFNFNVRQNLYWGPEEKFLVINSSSSDAGGFGRAGLFVSLSPFNIFTPIKEFTNLQHYNSYITSVRLDDRRILFTVLETPPDCDALNADCPQSAPENFVYVIDTASLKMLN